MKSCAALVNQGEIVLKGCGTAKRWRALVSKYQGHAKPLILQDTMVPV
jgi:hypothetical protein